MSAAVRPTSRLVGLTNEVVRFAPLMATVDCETKFVPVMVTVVCVEPARMEVGESEVTEGVGLETTLIVNTIGGCEAEGEVPPPGVGVVTEMSTVPGFSISDDGIFWSSSLMVMKVGGGNGMGPAEVIQVTCVCCTRLLPRILRMNCGEFAFTLVGETELSWAEDS